MTIIPKLIIHGGCGRYEGEHARVQDYETKLKTILDSAYSRLVKKDAKSAVVFAMRLLEDEELFNAGYGSKLQRDGTARMSASFMNGNLGRFSAVINVENVRHPIDIAKMLNRQKHTVIAGAPAESFARKKSVPVFNPVAPHRLEEHFAQKSGETGTCGVVALDSSGLICVATSTGGIGYEVPGRVGDSPTVAGNYASKHCGVSCTGIGEHIINLAVAARVVTQVDDGQSLNKAVNGVIRMGNDRKCRFGLISIDSSGAIKVGQTRGVNVLAAWHDGTRIETFLTNSSHSPFNAKVD